MLALAKLGHRCPPLLAALASALQQPEMVFTPRGLVDLLWSTAALQQVPAGMWTGLLLPVQMALSRAQQCKQQAPVHAHRCRMSWLPLGVQSASELISESQSHAVRLPALTAPLVAGVQGRKTERRCCACCTRR